MIAFPPLSPNPHLACSKLKNTSCKQVTLESSGQLDLTLGAGRNASSSSSSSSHRRYERSHRCRWNMALPPGGIEARYRSSENYVLNITETFCNPCTHSLVVPKLSCFKEKIFFPCSRIQWLHSVSCPYGDTHRHKNRQEPTWFNVPERAS